MSQPFNVLPPSQRAEQTGAAEPEPELTLDTSDRTEATSTLPRRSCLGCAGWALLVGGLLALWGVTFAGRVDTTPAAPLVIAVLLLPWLHAAATILALLALLRLRRSRWLGVVVVLHLVLELGVRGQDCAPLLPLPSASTEPELRIMAWNVGRLGAFARDDEARCSPEAARQGVLDTIREAGPEVLVLLEISGRRLATLADELALDCEQIDYYGRGGKGTGGLAVCVASEGPWRITRGRDLPLPPGWRYVFTEISDGERTFNVMALHVLPYGVTMREVERALRAAAEGEPGPLMAVLSQMEEAVATQVEQVASVRRLVGGFEDPTIVAGDFNSTPDSAVHVTLRRQLSDAWQRAGRGLGITRLVGGWLPLRIDYVYTTDELEPVGARTVDCHCDQELSCSDHRALEVGLLLPRL
jgi:endonuclease/exonuclease/phosphatase family metal-dependent hydrolase